MATIREIAKEAGVAISTASTVLNHKSGQVKVSERTKERIFAVAKKLNYVPNTIAQGLRTGRSMQIGLLTVFIQNSLHPYIIQGIEDILNSVGYSTLLCIYNSEEELRKRVLHLTQKRIDGLLIYPRLDFSYDIFQRLVNNIPTVTFAGKLPNSNIPCVKVDGKKVGYLALKHLFELGHKKIAICCSQKGSERYCGAMQAIKKFNIPDDNIKFYFGSMDFAKGRKIFNELIETNKYTGVYAYGDECAAGMVYQAAENNVKIPEQLSIIGTNDLPIATQVFPQLTTICQPKREQGIQAAKLLINLINKKQTEAADIILSPKLIIRNSTTVQRIINSHTEIKDIAP